MSTGGTATTHHPAGAARPAPEPTDPRPWVVREGDAWLVEGGRCTACGYPATRVHLRCPVCAGAMEPDRFGPGGTVFASTVLRIPVAGREPPYGLAYVDLDRGPRILAHVREAASPVPVGSAVAVVGATSEGDPLVAAAGAAR